MTISGGVTTSGSINIVSPANVTGEITAINGTTYGGTNVAASTDAQLGLIHVGDITLYSDLPNYTYQGQPAVARLLSANFAGGTLLDPDVAHNPANVWYTTADRTFTGSTVLNGTLATKTNKSITINGNLTITPRPTMPALLVQKNLTLQGTDRRVQLNGMTHIGAKLGGAGATLRSSIEINGAAFFDAKSSPINTASYLGLIIMRFNADNLHVANVADDLEQPESARILSWQNPVVEP